MGNLRKSTGDPALAFAIYVACVADVQDEFADEFAALLDSVPAGRQGRILRLARQFARKAELEASADHEADAKIRETLHTATLRLIAASDARHSPEWRRAARTVQKARQRHRAVEARRRAVVNDARCAAKRTRRLVGRFGMPQTARRESHGSAPHRHRRRGSRRSTASRAPPGGDDPPLADVATLRALIERELLDEWRATAASDGPADEVAAWMGDAATVRLAATRAEQRALRTARALAGGCG